MPATDTDTCRRCKKTLDITRGSYAGLAMDLFFCDRCVWHLEREFKLTGRPQNEDEGARWMEEQYAPQEGAA